MKPERVAAIAASIYEDRATNLANMKEMGIATVKLLSCGSSCQHCENDNGMVFPIDQAPNPPVLKCSREWCRCVYLAEL